MKKSGRKNIAIVCLACMSGIILLEVFFLFSFYRKQVMGLPEVNETVWSSILGAADGRIILNHTQPSISQEFTVIHENPEKIILFFYHCDEPQSGILHIRLKDEKGIVYNEGEVDLAWYNEDVLCYILEVESELQKGRQYFLEVSVTDIGENYIEVGSTADPSKPAVYKNFDDGTTFFVGIEYTYKDDTLLKKNLTGMIVRFSVVDLAIIGIILTWLTLGIAGKKRVAAAVTVIIGIVVLAGVFGYIIWPGYREKNAWHNRYSFIAHAMGGMDGHQYLNCLEAFEKSYEGGHKVFEVDFAITSDGEVVLKHDWEKAHGLPEFENGYIPTHDEFMSAKIWGKYTTMDLYSLFNLMIEHKDIYIMTDSKEDGFGITTQQFTRVREILSEYSASEQRHIRNHLIVQIYNDDMYTAVENAFGADNYLYTIYKKGGTDKIEEVLRFSKNHDIPVITMPYTWWSEDVERQIHSEGLKVYLHTLNKPEDIADYSEKGIDGFYTDEPEISLLQAE